MNWISALNVEKKSVFCFYLPVSIHLSVCLPVCFSLSLPYQPFSFSMLCGHSTKVRNLCGIQSQASDLKPPASRIRENIYVFSPNHLVYDNSYVVQTDGNMFFKSIFNWDTWIYSTVNHTFHANSLSMPNALLESLLHSISVLWTPLCPSFKFNSINKIFSYNDFVQVQTCIFISLKHIYSENNYIFKHFKNCQV